MTQYQIGGNRQVSVNASKSFFHRKPPMRGIARAAAQILLLSIATSSFAQISSGVYRGELECGPHLTLPSRPGWKVPITVRIDGQSLSWQRGGQTYEESGQTQLSSSGEAFIRVLGKFLPPSGQTGQWAGTAKLQVTGSRLSGTMTQTSFDGTQRARDCTFAADLSLAGGATVSASSAGTSTLPEAQANLPLLEKPGAPYWKDAPAYDAKHAATVLRRSTFFLPLFGAVFPEKFESLLNQLPETSLRGVVIYNHGCGGQWGFETHVAMQLYRWGFAVITPDFLARDGNKSGCPGVSGDDMLRASAVRAREGIYQAINPARLAARGQDIQVVIDWLKARTRLPIILSGHSEGCRAIYSMYVTDPQVVGGACVKQGLQPNFSHTWRWNTRVPMWQSLEENDPWVVSSGATHVSQVTFTSRFTSNPTALTVVIVPGHTHDPLNNEIERESLRQWLGQRAPQRWTPGQNGMDYEKALPALQERLRTSR